MSTKEIMNTKEFYAGLLECTSVDEYKSMLKLAQQEQDKIKFYTVLIMLMSFKDRQEYTNNVAKKSYFLSTFIRDEFITKGAEDAKTHSITIHRYALMALTGLGFLVEDKVFTYNLTPMDREFWQLKFKVDSSAMKNSQICYYNSKYELNIPQNEEKETVPDEEQYDCGFIKSEILKLI